jgi:tetratricopeptide (TPR) repeat protein
MVAYFRGYCRERLGQLGLVDYKLASRLPTSYVFPSSADESTVLNAALRANPDDASAHYLLGTLLFSRGVTELALAEWSKAQTLNPNIPVLAASMGLALLHEKNDPERAASAFRDGLRSDPANVTIYLGADQALSVLGKPSKERIEVLEKYPHLADAPSGLIFELILNLAEAGDFQRAEALFHDHFFAREEGGTNVRQVWVEVELQKLLAWTRETRCADAIALGNRIGAEVPGLPFTKDGLEPIVQSARTQYLLGTAYTSCGKREEVTLNFQSASTASAPDQTLWSWKAAKQLPGFDEKQWRERLQTALAQAKARSETSSYPSWWDYTAGTLAGALGETQEAEAQFRKALLLPDRMLAYHLTRLARLGTSQ